jgi:hypothetical protein
VLSSCLVLFDLLTRLEFDLSPVPLSESYLIMEGRSGQPKMMTVGLHCRLSRPGRVAALAEFVDYAKSYGREVWICTRESIANHWYEHHLPRGIGSPIEPGALAAGKGGRFSFLGNLTTPREGSDVLSTGGGAILAKARNADADVI